MALRRCSVLIETSVTHDRRANAGAAGLVGSRLVAKLSSQGHTVRVLTRNVANAKANLPYRGLTFSAPADWESAVKGCTAVVNLAGAVAHHNIKSILTGQHSTAQYAMPPHSSPVAPSFIFAPNPLPQNAAAGCTSGEHIATRWTPELKKQIKASRIDVTRSMSLVVSLLPHCMQPPAWHPTGSRKTLLTNARAGCCAIAELHHLLPRGGAPRPRLCLGCRCVFTAHKAEKQQRHTLSRLAAPLACLFLKFACLRCCFPAARFLRCE